MFYVKKLFIVGALIMNGCATVDRVELLSDDPEDGIVEVRAFMEAAKDEQHDLLASDEFQKGESTFYDAIDSFKEDRGMSNTLDLLAQSKAYFVAAQRVASNRKAVPARVLEARKSAIKSGALKEDSLTSDIEDIDDSLRYETGSFSEILPVEKISDFERDYLKVEVSAVQNRELGMFRRVIVKAQNNKIPKLAPQTYRSAVNDLKAAENMIQQSSRSPQNYRASVMASKKSSQLLDDVTMKLSGVARGSSEEAVLAMVHQERELGNLSDLNTGLEGRLSRSADKLAAKTQEADLSENRVLSQSVLDEMRKSFTPVEADVYQQGKNLIIRLKNINFAIGSSVVPNKSLDLLSKVNAAILKLNSSKVVVEGHTDFTGSTEGNLSLSSKRSKAVADLLKLLGKSRYEIQSTGLGEASPIASNQTKDGRAMNRRVDIVVNSN